MYIDQIYTNCLAEAAYYIESDGVAAIVDPLRETEPYIEKAKERGAQIKYIFETHFHADFVSGHIDLAKKTGATIVYGPNANPSYEVKVAEDEEILELGACKIKVLHTPGHTLESSTYLLLDADGKEHAIFTGDTLFIGDVGRPDLAVNKTMKREDLAGMLYDSLRNKIMPLQDDVVVYPAHGAGSACGKNMSDETFATLGSQKATNYALQDISKEEFVQQLTEGISPAPQYFAKNARINQSGYDSIDEVMERAHQPLSVEQVEQALKERALLLDTRPSADFCEAHIPGSLSIGLDGSYAVWAGTLIEDIDQKIIVLAEPGKESEAILRLARVGYDHCIGYLEGGMATWKNAGKKWEKIHSVTVQSFEEMLQNEHPAVLDVRKESEYAKGHLTVAENHPLDFIADWKQNLNPDQTYYLHCKSGYRSTVAASILSAQGIKKLVNVEGGYDALSSETAIPIQAASELAN